MFLACQWEIAIGGMGGVLYLGIAGHEIEAVSRMLGIESGRDLLCGVREMVDAALPLRNPRQ